jgi:hypothetical protein
MQFGRSSERVTWQIEQLELRLKELEAREAEAISQAAREDQPLPIRQRSQPKRKKLPNQEAAEVRGMGGRMLATAVGTIEVGRRRRCRATEWPVVADIPPQSPVRVRPRPGSRTGTGVSSPWIFSPANSCRRIPSTIGYISQTAWPTQSLSVERSRSSPSRA